jgi:hypothetical protein
MSKTRNARENSSAPKPAATAKIPDVSARKQFGKLQIPAHWKVDTTLAQSGTKLGVIGSLFKPKR